jgi:hypothetical protein
MGHERKHRKPPRSGTKTQEVMLRAMAKLITCWKAAEIIEIRCRQMRRSHRRFEEHGYHFS